ncbi:MAG: diguanylate cyclase [Candidatus Eremiobacteraeota bacterium]|nr:diguanylate cyclase [Candidatus Eremiobacteraeota bacterium]MBV8643207.1 diguanylate cyclase [Candidatus Eremiobacteraeota bacterium]
MSEPTSPLGDATDDQPIIVLLVDDQAIIGEAIRIALSDQKDIDLHYCSDSLGAIEVAERIKPTVILQDLVMPGVDGLSLVKKYRAAAVTREVPIIVLSTKEEPEVKRQAFEQGADDYLVKLPSTIELVARIRKHSQAYVSQKQRDAAYDALRQSQKLLLEKNLELERLTNVDGLTGLSNRRYFEEFMAVQWPRAVREQTPFSILVLDVDDFKRYNDTYGHLAGDGVLRAVAAAVRGCCRRPTDLAVRFGGEEFLVILVGEPNESARAFGERIRSAVEADAILHAGATTGRIVTVSIGVASKIPQVSDKYADLIEAADVAMYAAKHGGKNRVVSAAAA